MNFGGKIVILYLSFVTLIVTLVVMCYMQDVELVSKDYYTQELNFQKKINAINNTNSLTSSINHEVSNNKIILKIDSTLLSNDFNGTINFYCPSNSKNDIEIKMNFKDKIQIINTDKIAHGAYKLQLSWVSNQKTFYKEDVILIN